MRWYVGLWRGNGVAFRCERPPTENSHPRYNAVIGPFVTKRGAVWCAKHRNNQCLRVSEIEQAAKKESLNQNAL